ncbi:MAG: shikimate dehydrogenase [Eubacteriales bacterium]|nr:shikimate dehydrogenase [Eubacteriales bacterium]
MRNGNSVTIDGKTRVCGLIGNPVEHTISPDIHNTLANACGINLAYVPFHVETGRLEAAVRGAFALNVLGMNVTVPYKKEVLLFLQDADPLAAAMESVNTLVRTQDGYKGFNTDMSGLFRAMQEDGVSLEREEVIVLGAGGVGRAVAFLCAMKGASRVYLLNRSVEKARQVAREVNERSGNPCVHAMELKNWRELPDRKYLCIQATSVGLYPDSDRAAVEEEAFYEKIHTGYDLIYRPSKTKFMSLTEKAGGKAFNGLKMLVYQGVEAFELWNAVTAPKEAVTQIYEMLAAK